uniref:GUN4-like domain-containing protein n=1 Tax=Thorea hispida TaxID=202687 RepID=A0A1Z1XAA3_9FLOR|nr:hypothetical protein [Thorea hispida]
MLQNNFKKQLDQLNHISSLPHRSDDLSILIESIYNNGIIGQRQLLTFIIHRYTNKSIITSWIDGQIFELLLKSPFSIVTNALKKDLPDGVICLDSESQINYKLLQELLVNNKFQEANKITEKILYQLSKKSNNHSKYRLYFSDIYTLPCQDLKIIDQLWKVHSKGLFGLSVQKNIWKANHKNWYQFYKTISWINSKDIYRHYPAEFIWDTSAPRGHLPLFNQIRGHHVLEALFTYNL